MNQRIFHGKLSAQHLADHLIAEFHQGNFNAQKLGQTQQVVVQIASARNKRAGGQTALTITLQQLKEGVQVTVGEQAWFGVAASLGKTAFKALHNPFSLLGRIEHIAQDLESLQLNERVWQVVQRYAHSVGASHQLSERLRRMICEYCNTPNETGANRCLACGAPLGNVQPRTCRNCGFVVHNQDTSCPNCKKPL